MTMKTTKLRIWHIPNPPRKGFKKYVEDVDEAKRILTLLADYDLYLGELIDSNAQGLEELVDGEWGEWYNDDDKDICEIIDSEHK